MEAQHASYGQHTEMIRVGDLGTFSMQSVYDALANSLITAPKRATSELTAQLESKANDSDCSWTLEEESGDFYIRMRRTLDDFILSPDQTTMTTDELSRHERRFVHATAQVMRLGHASQGPSRSRNRRMVVYKTPHSTSPGVFDQEHQKSVSWADDIDTFDDATSLASGTLSQRKRKRQEKLQAGYPCPFPPCPKLFDRASERNKHAQAHQPAFTNRFTCPLCSKGFRYPKDLRRHTTRVHESATSRPIFDPTYASFGSMTLSSTLTYESRIPSETSLVFNSAPSSKNVSPRLAGQVPDGMVEPLWLADCTAIDLSGHGSLGLPFQELADFDFDGHDFGEDDGVLEMARVRK